MSSQTLMFSIVAAVALMSAGCGKKEASTAAPSAPSATSTPAAAPAASTGPRVLQLTANDTMKFAVPGSTAKPGDPIRLEAKAGESIRIVLQNTGALPKEAMGHNLVVLKAGVDVNAFATAAIAAGPAKNYFPTEREADTLAHTPIIGPKAKTEASFTVPTEPGEYAFLCTFPGHFAAGMKGVLVVSK